MKQFIVLAAMTMLGVFIYNMIAGDGEDSLINLLEGLFRQEIKVRGGGF